MTRVAVLQFFHEASSIAPSLVTRDEFLARHHLRGAAVAETFGETNNWLGGVLSGLADRGITPQIGLCTACLPGGPVAAPDFAALLAEFLASLEDILADGPLSHVFLVLHGACLVAGRTDPEGDLTRAVRSLVGEQTRIAVTLDFHANPGPGILAAADLVIGGKLYPHTDTRARGRRLVDLAFAPQRLRTTHHRLGLQVPMPRQQTTEGAFAELALMTDELNLGGIADVTLLGGFPFSDAPFCGTSLLITATEGVDRRPTVQHMSRAVTHWQDALLAPVPTPAEAVPEIRERVLKGRVVIGDVGDNPGGGATGASAHLLHHLLPLGRPVGFGFLVDAALVLEAQVAGVGGLVTIRALGGPIPARVERLQEVRYRNQGPMMTGEELYGGAGAVLSIGASRVLVSSLRVQAYDLAAFTSMGVEPERMDILAVKSIGHFRASYTPLATGGTVLVDTGGLSSPRRVPGWEKSCKQIVNL